MNDFKGRDFRGGIVLWAVRWCCRKEWELPEVLNTDKAPAYAAAITELKAEGKCPTQTRHRQVKYLNNVIEADHGKLKQPDPARARIQDDEDRLRHDQGLRVMRALRKGQAEMFSLQGGIVGEARIVERAFGVRAVCPDRGHGMATGASGQRTNMTQAQ